VPKRIEEYAAAMVKRQSLKETDSDDDMGPESHSAESRSINAGIDDRRVDHFWSKVFDMKHVTGKERYPALQKVVVASLVIAHGNADVERGPFDNQ